MQRQRQNTHRFLPALFLVGTTLIGSSRADTLVVDDSGGAGVDFTSIDGALNAAASGDAILVRPGNYSPFTLDAGITLLGEVPDTVTVSGKCFIKFIEAGERVVLSGMKIPELRVERCDGTVVLDSLRIERFFPHPEANQRLVVIQSADVRIHGCTVRHGSNQSARFFDSRVQVVSSTIAGKRGEDAESIDPEDGGDGLVAEQCPLVHVARSSLLGGDGGYPFDACPIDVGGDGGVGLSALDCGILAAGRASDEISGGRGGIGAAFSCDGYDGAGAVLVGGSLQHSGVTIQSGGFGAPDVSLNGTTELTPAPADPTLALGELTPAAGAVLGLLIDGPPGSVVILVVSDRPELAATPGVLVDSLVQRSIATILGVIPPSGTLSASYTAQGQTGDILHVQAEVFVDRATRMRTNSAPIVLR